MWLHSFPFSFFLKECFIHFFLCVWSDSIHFNWMYGKFFFLPVALFYNNSIYLSIFLVSNFESYVNHYGKPEIKSSNSKHEMRSFHDPYTIYIYIWSFIPSVIMSSMFYLTCWNTWTFFTDRIRCRYTMSIDRLLEKKTSTDGYMYRIPKIFHCFRIAFCYMIMLIMMANNTQCVISRFFFVLADYIWLNSYWILCKHCIHKQKKKKKNHDECALVSLWTERVLNFIYK